MDLKRSQPGPSDAFERMDGETYGEYRALKASGMFLDPERYLAFRERPGKSRHVKLVVEDSGIFFMDTTRRIKYKMSKDYFLVYHAGLHLVDEQKINDAAGPIVLLDNLLEFWKKQGTGLCLVADHLNNCEYLAGSQKSELENTQKLYQKDGFILHTMLQKKAKETPAPSVQVLSLED